jgi:hypothetical protein
MVMEHKSVPNRFKPGFIITKIIMKNQRVLLAILLRIMIVLGLFLIFNILPIQNLVPCTYPISQSLAFIIFLVLVFEIILFGRIWILNRKLIMVMYSILLLLVLWLGSYPFSPLGFSTGRIPVLKGFIVSRFSRPPITIPPGGTVNIPGGSISEIKPVTLPVPQTCTWASTNGGALDDPGSCDTAYLSPAGTYYDTLKLLIHPACHLPSVDSEIRVSILP